MSTTRAHIHLAAPRARVYRALLDADAVRRWRVPDGMTSEVHAFEGREGGTFRVSLTYDPGMAGVGKSTARTDTYHGRFVRLVPDSLVVETLAFESPDPSMQGEMTITFTLTDAPGGGTDLAAVHENVPASVPPQDNALGWRLSLAKLKRLVESLP